MPSPQVSPATFETTTASVPVFSHGQVGNDGPSTDTLSVLQVINGEHFSGAERVQQVLGIQLPGLGVATEFACLKPGKFTTHSGLDPDRIHAVPMKGRMDWRAVASLRRLVEAKGFDILHAHTPRSALVASMVAQQLNLPWVYHVHSPTSRDSTRWWINSINQWMEQWSLRHCTKIVTVSRSLRRELLRHGWSRDRLVTIGNGVSSQPPIEPLTRLHCKSWRMGMVALHRPRKGIEVLLDAIARLQEDHVIDNQGSQFQLDIIGGFETKQYENEIKQRVERLGIGHSVRWVGFTNDVPAAMRELDVMILPSLFGEGMPMVVLEAMAMGVPVIATRVEGTPEVVRDRREGLLATPGDAASLASAMRGMMNCRTQWQAFSQNAMARHRAKFTDVRMAARMARVYRAIIGRPPCRPC